MASFDGFLHAVRRLVARHGLRTAEHKPADPLTQQALALIKQGNALEDVGQLVQARALYDNAVHLAPTLAKTHLNLGNVLLALDLPEAAIQAYLAALAHQPDLAAAHFNTGNAHIACNRPADALKAYDRALAINTIFVDAIVAKGNVFGDLKQLDSAVACYQKALQLSPNYAEVHLNLANTFRAQSRLNDAVLCFNRVLLLTPDSPEIHRSIGLALKALDRLDDAVKSFAAAVALKPDYVMAQIDLANTYRELGEISKAVEIARLAVTLDPNEPGAWSLLFFCLSNSEDVDKQVLFAEHRRFGDHFEPQLQSYWRPHPNVRDPERVLQVGVVSGDLRNHAVTSFFEPVLLLLLKMDTLSIHIYDTTGLEDDVTRRIKAQVNHWNDVETLSPDKLADLIRQDAVDVLIDLSGHTPANHLLTFARKPAPVQMSWIGYPGTTGLKSMDYYVGDRHFLPPGEYDGLFSEKILRIPANAPFQPLLCGPEVNTLPAFRNGFITFASFNRIDKIGKNVVRAWSRLLNALPTSKMIMAGMPIGGSFDQLTDWFAQEGVAAHRLEFRQRSNMGDYLAMHHQVDVCLDTFPYGGGTTTCHALWMGVPTLTLVGTTPAACVGRAILSHVNLQTTFCAKDLQDFVNKGLWCAEHLAYLQDLRLTLREKFQQSAISQPGMVAGGLELAMRHAWRLWCADLPTVSFEVSHDSGEFCVDDPHPPTS